MSSSIKQGYNGKLFKSIFFTMVLSGVLHYWILCVGSVVDSLFAGRFVGTEGLASVAFFAPVQVFVWLLINIIANGGNVVIGRIIGRGEFDSANRIFSFCCVFLFVFGLVIAAACMIFTNQLCLLLGARGDSVSLSMEYMRGYAIGIPFMMPLGFLTSMMVYSRNQKVISVIAAVLFVISDSVLNFVFIKVLNMGMFGLGLATSFSNLIVAVLLIFQHLLGRSVLAFNFRKIPFSFIGEILRVGIPAASIELYIVIRVFAYNKLLFLNGGGVAVCAYGVTCVIEGFMNAVSNGISGTVMSVGSIIIGEQDSSALKTYSSILYKYGCSIMLFFSVLLFFIAPFVCVPFVKSDEVALQFSIEAVRFLSASYLFSLIFNINMRFYQVQERNAFVSVIYVFSNLVFPVGSALVLTHFVSVRGVWISLVLTAALSLLLIYVCAAFMTKKPFLRIMDLLSLGKPVIENSDEQISLTVSSQSEVLNLVGYILDFGKNNGMSEKVAMYTAMAIEELAGNIVQHGFNADNKKHSIDIKITRHADSIFATVKDDCMPFNPKQFYELYDKSDPAKNVGLRIVFGFCKEVQYKSMFGLNVTMFKVGI